MLAYKFLTLFLVIASTYCFAQFTNIAVTTNTYDQSEPTISVSPLNSNIVLTAYNDSRTIGNNTYSKAGYAFSTNTGQTWSEALLTAPGYTNGVDPSVAFDRNGNAFYCYIAYSIGPIGNVYVSKTTTFQPPYSWSHKLVSEENHYNDKPFMTVDNTGGSKDGRIYVSWTDLSSGSKIKFSYSSDQGSVFSTPLTLSALLPSTSIYAYLIPTTITEGDPTVEFVHGSMPAVGPNGELYVIWANVTTNGVYHGGRFIIRKSTDGGVTFGPKKTVCYFTPRRDMIGKLDNRTYIPSMSVDPLTGNIYVVYSDQASTSNTNLRNKFVRLTDGGNTWSSPMTIADFGIGWQLMPQVSTDENGRVSVLLIHSSNLSLVDSYLTESHDNGVNFRTPLRVSTQSSDPTKCTWTHHYIGIANIGSGNSYSVWTDYRNLNADPYFSKVNPSPIEPTGFYVTGNIGEHPTLHWNPNEELDLGGYNIYQRIDQGSWHILITVDKYTTSFTDPGVTITDRKLDPRVCYTISAIDLAGNESPQIWPYGCVLSNIFQKKTEYQASIFEYSLSEAFPNPFNPTTKIKYSIGKNGFVTIRVLDVLGNVVATLVNEEKQAGEYSVDFNASNMPSGIYFYKINSRNYTATKKLILLK